jgi:hypothetical protein
VIEKAVYVPSPKRQICVLWSWSRSHPKIWHRSSNKSKKTPIARSGSTVKCCAHSECQNLISWTMEIRAVWGLDDAQKAEMIPAKCFGDLTQHMYAQPSFFLCNLMFLQFDIGFFARMAGWLCDKLNYPVEQRQKVLRVEFFREFLTKLKLISRLVWMSADNA